MWSLTSELQPSQLERDETVAQLYDVDEGIEVVWGHDETVALGNVTPPPHQ